MTYTIDKQTLQSIARLRDLQVARIQIAELKEYGFPLTKSEEANTAAVEFRNGSSELVVLPFKRVAAWAALLPAGAINVVVDEHAVRFSKGGSEVKFWRSTTPQSEALVVDAGTGSEFKLVGATADETELAAIKQKLAAVRKSAKHSKELGNAKANEREAFGELRQLTNRARANRQTIAEKPLAQAIADARTERTIRNQVRSLNQSIEAYWSRKVNLPILDGLPTDAVARLTDLHDRRAASEKKQHVRKAEGFLVALGNDWVDSWKSALALRSPEVQFYAGRAAPYRNYSQRCRHMGRQSSTPSLSAHSFPNDGYTRARKQLRGQPAELARRTETYLLALGRLRKLKK